MPPRKAATTKTSIKLALKDDGKTEKEQNPVKRKRAPSKATAKAKADGDATGSGNAGEAPTVTKRKVAGTYRPKWLGEPRDPPKHGSKPIPVGKPDCLKNIIFVLSGLNESLTRDEMSELISRYGGIERSAVSGKTNYLVVGFEMEDGRPITEGSKYKKAVEKNVKIINEDELLAMIRASNPEASAASEAEQLKSKQLEEENAVQKEETLMKDHDFVSSDLFTVKYAPSSIKEIIGNEGIIENVKQWLTQWDDVFIHKRITVKHTSQNPDAKAVLLSGPPGIGKTTSAHIIAKECGYEIVELNASDTRNRKSVQRFFNDMIVTKNVHQFFSDHSSAKTDSQSKPKVGNANAKILVVMDEVDGMGGGDRGGIGELIQVIEASMIPIICICNDRDNKKIQSLARKCYDCSFGKLPQDAMITRLQFICKKEEIAMSKADLAELVESSGGDMRQCLNKLQYYKLENVSSMSDTLPSLKADTLENLTAFQVARKLLTEGCKYSFQDRYSLFFNDYSLTPLIIEDCYLPSITSKHYKDEKTIEAMVDAADSLCDVEILNNAILKSNNWGLLPSLSTSVLRTCSLAAGSFVMTKFPAFFGNLSKQRKNQQLFTTLSSHFLSQSASRKKDLILDVCEVLNQQIISPLHKDDVDEAVKRLNEFGLAAEDVTETLDRILLCKEATYDSVSTKTKRSFSQAWKKLPHMHSNSTANSDDLWTRKSRKRGAASATKKSKKTEVQAEDEQEESSDSELLFF